MAELPSLPADALLHIVSFLSPVGSRSAAQVAVLRGVCPDWAEGLSARVFSQWSWSKIDARSARTGQAGSFLAAVPRSAREDVRDLELVGVEVGEGATSFAAALRLQSVSLGGVWTTDPGANVLAFLGPSLPHLRSVTLRSLPQLNGASLASLVAAAPNVERLVLDGCGALQEVTGTNADGSVLVAAPHVLRLPGMREPLSLPLTDVDVHVCAPWWGALTSLSLLRCGSISDGGVATILGACARLTTLDLSGCRQLGGDAALWDALEASSLRRLVTLKLSAFGSAAAVSDACREHAAVRLRGLTFPALLELNVSWCPWMNDEVAIALGHALASSPRLTRLSVHACTAMTGDGLAGLQAGLRSSASCLLALDLGQLGGVTDANIAALLSTPFPRLRSLNVSGCPHVGQLTYSAIGMHAHELHELGSRLTVSVGSEAIRAWLTAAREERGGLRRKALEQRARTRDAISPSAASTPLSPNSSLAWEKESGSEAVGTPTSAQSELITLPLTSLDWWRAQEIGDSACSLLSASAPNLRHLTLDGCDVALTDAGAAAIASNCPLLTSVSLVGTPLSDVTLRALARSRCAPRLSYIDLSDSCEYSRSGLEALWRGCHALDSVKLVRCAGVCDGSLAVLLAHATRLRILTIEGCSVSGVGVAASVVWTTLDGDAASDAAPASGDAGTGTGDTLTAASLRLLGEATLTGRLAVLGIGAVQGFTLRHYANFLTDYALNRACALEVLKLGEGCTSAALERLEGILRDVAGEGQRQAYPAQLAAARARASRQAGTTGRRHRALLRLEHAIEGMRLEWRASGEPRSSR